MPNEIVKPQYELTKELETGNAIIDGEHRALFQAVNKLIDARFQGKAHEVLAVTVEFLLNYVDSHFDHEEQLQLQSGYPAMDSHKAFHAVYRERLREVIAAIPAEGAGEKDLAALNANVAILVNHIRTEDKKLGAFLTESSKRQCLGKLSCADIDIEKTRAYYDAIDLENLREQYFFRNYCARVKESYPEFSAFLSGIGVDIEKPHSVWPAVADENDEYIEYSFNQYIVFGECPDGYTEKIGDIELRKADWYAGADIAGAHFALEIPRIKLLKNADSILGL